MIINLIIVIIVICNYRYILIFVGEILLKYYYLLLNNVEIYNLSIYLFVYHIRHIFNMIISVITFKSIIIYYMNNYYVVLIIKLFKLT
jgi:hypothetical protein